MATYVVRTTINPDEEFEVSEAEYERLLALGILLNEDPDPMVGVFDTEVAALIDDVASLTRASFDSRYVVGDGVRKAISLTQGAYSAISSKNPETLYIIVD